MPSYVKSAPQSLIDWYENRTISKGRDLLQRLLTHVDMETTWPALIKNATRPDHAKRLFTEIVYIEQESRKPIRKSRTEVRDDWLQVSKQARSLLTSIEGGALDKLLYEFFSAESMEINGIDGWDRLDVMARVSRAHTLLREWPALTDVLENLVDAANRLADGAMSTPRLIERAPKQPTDYRKLYFVRKLAEFIAAAYNKPLYASVAGITNAILDTNLIDSEIPKIVKPC